MKNRMPPSPPPLSQAQNPTQRPPNGGPTLPGPAYGQGQGHPAPSHGGGHGGHPGGLPPGGPGGPAGPGGPPHRRRRPPPGGPGRPQPPRQSSGGLSWLLYAVLGLVAIVVAGVAFLMIAPPTDIIREQAIAQVKKYTGRDLTIGGPTSFTFYPALGVSMNDVSLSAPPEMGGAPLAKMDRLTVRIRLLPLLRQQIAVDTLVFDKPVFDLRVDKTGRKSWDFARVGTSSQRVQLAQGSTGTRTDVAALQTVTGAGGLAAGSNLDALKQLELGDVRIDNGTLRYSDAKTGSKDTLDAINVTLGLQDIAAPLQANGNLRWKSETIEFDSTLTSVQSILKDRPAKLRVNLSARPVTAQFNGALVLGDVLGLDGNLTANSKSLRALAKWFGTDLPKANGYGPLDAKGRLSVQGPTYSFIDANVGLDGATATGTVSVDSSGQKPHVRADLKLSVLDLNKYMASGSAGAPSKGGGKKPAPKPKAAPAKKSNATGGPQSIDDLLNRDGPQVRGYTQREGWSNDKIDLTALKTFDADAKLSVGRLLVKKIKVGRSQLTVKVKSGVMKANLDEMQLYDGSGRGIVNIDGNKAAAGVGLSLAIDGVAAEPLLSDAAGIDFLSGSGRLTVAVSGRAGSERQLIETLGGTAKFNFTDGALVGVNIPAAIRGLKSGQVGSLKQSPSEKTDFSELSASFIIKKGVAQNQDLKMLSPLLRVTGAGRVMLPPRQLDYTVKPKLVADLRGQGGDDALSGLVIPVRIHGPFAHLSYTPDLAGVLANPDAAVDTVKKIGEQFKGKKAGEILDDLLGGGESNGEANDGTDSGDGSKKKFDTKKLLKGLFGN